MTLRGSAPSDVAGLLSRGDELLASGDFTSARLFYRRGAESGDGTAALRLAESFDPVFLGRAGLPQIAGDATKAAFWYQRAHDLGVRDAALLLKHIDPSKQP
jgi:TPR repeat protein